MTFSRKKIGVLAAISCVLCVQAALADPYFDQGKKLYDKKQYGQALPYFHKSATDQPWDSTSAYYEALCYHMMGDYKNAATAYANVVEHFPGSAAYVNAAAALKVLDPGYFERHAQSTTASSSPSKSAASSSADDVDAMLANVTISAPNESKIPVQRALNKTSLTARVNGVSVPMEFAGDTTTISQQVAKAARLQPVNGRAQVTVSAGEITESGFPIKIGDSNRLGTDFLRKFSYRLGLSDISVTKSGGAGAYNLAFQKTGNDLRVHLTINGRSVSNVILDLEGGENICPRNRTRELGLDVEDQSVTNMRTLQNPDGALRGDPNFGQVKEISSAAAKVSAVGPVGTGQNTISFNIRDGAKDVRVSASAFPGWQADVDEANKVIHFTRH